MLFRSRAGEAEEAWRYECIAEDYKSEYSKRMILRIQKLYLTSR